MIYLLLNVNSRKLQLDATAHLPYHRFSTSVFFVLHLSLFFFFILFSLIQQCLEVQYMRRTIEQCVRIQFAFIEQIASIELV